MKHLVLPLVLITAMNEEQNVDGYKEVQGLEALRRRIKKIIKRAADRYQKTPNEILKRIKEYEIRDPELTLRDYQEVSTRPLWKFPMGLIGFYAANKECVVPAFSASGW
ncbi:hypothetical protein FQR65_LT02035 [Abscondita terminalis]|nr:hypothetical protein FQR65_LT02035 [Abscondita terminalis]